MGTVQAQQLNLGNNMAVEFIPASKEKIVRNESGLELQDIYDLVSKHADRLGIDRDVAFENALSFADTVGTLENDGKLEGGNRPQKGKEASSAKGLYQFVDGSIGPAKKRLKRNIDIEVPDRVEEMTWNQQTLLFLADMLEKTAVVGGKKVPGLGDELMKGVLQDASNTEAVKKAYYILHHTNPDEATKKRTERILNGTSNSN